MGGKWFALALVPLLFVAPSCAGGDGDQPRGDDAPRALAAADVITEFRGEDPDRSLLAIAALAGQRLDELRVAALGNIDAKSPAVRYAATLALARTAAPGASIDALKGRLADTDETVRLVAAAALLSLGHTDGVTQLIDALPASELLAYQRHPREEWRLARASLLRHTDQDFGLAAARDATASARTQVAWRGWWASAGATYRPRNVRPNPGPSS